MEVTGRAAVPRWGGDGWPLSTELARRLYLEAAKAVKYGGTSETEALKFVTLNPAKQLRIDQYVGSIEPGKDADLAIWSKSPLDSGTVCLQTWIDGKKYFDRSLNADAFATFTDDGHLRLEPASPTTDFSFDFHDLDFVKMAAH